MEKLRVAVIAMVALTIVPVPAPADPPPWAKAHGWRKKNDPNYVGYTGKKWPQDYGVVEGHCDTDKVGAVVGSKVGSPENRPVAIVVGTVLGAVIGAKVGRALDEADRACMGHALE